MKRSGLIGAVAALAALLAVPAPAQLAGDRAGFSSAPRQGTTEEFWFALRRLGDCLARSKERESQALLATEPSSSEEAAAARAMLGRYTGCLRHASRMVAPTNLIRGAIAEGLYRRQIAAHPPAVEIARPAAIDPDTAGTLVPYRVLAGFARCFAAKHPQRVHWIVHATRLGSDESHQAIAELEPLVPECLPPNVQIQFEPSEIRLALAEALYHHARAPAPREGSR